MLRTAKHRPYPCVKADATSPQSPSTTSNLLPPPTPPPPPGPAVAVAAHRATLACAVTNDAARSAGSANCISVSCSTARRCRAAVPLQSGQLQSSGCSCRPKPAIDGSSMRATGRPGSASTAGPPQSAPSMLPLPPAPPVPPLAGAKGIDADVIGSMPPPTPLAREIAAA